MKTILISNDDGYLAPGINALADSLSSLADIQVVAPDRNCSGASNALTLNRPLEAVRHTNGFVSIEGTPTDCVHLGVSGLFSDVPDIVVSGINAGANLGDDVLYSGTVAAAMEGRALDLPAIAVSLTSFHPKHFATAAQITKTLVSQITALKLPSRTVLNVNVPDVPLEEIQGMHITRLGHRAAAVKPQESTDPRGKLRFWIAGTGEAVDKGIGTDFYAIEHNFVSITPLHFDMTNYQCTDTLADWLEAMD